MQLFHFSHRSGASGQRCTHEPSSIQWRREQRPSSEQWRECSLRSGVTAVEQPIPEPHQRPARNIHGFGPRMRIFLDGNHSLGPARGGGETHWKPAGCLLFHIFSLYYYKTLHGQFLISTLEWNTEGQKQQKIKSISHPKGINNIKDKLFFPLKQIHSYEIVFYYYKK